MTETTKTTHVFEAAVEEVLRLVVHSLYSNPEIFLRELVSNAADALDKRRFEAIADPSRAAERLVIRVTADPGAGTLTVSDNGIGMSRDELVRNLGTIAHSGTKDFARRVEAARAKEVDFIGQFGVGFYSAFLVADAVDVVSRPVGTPSVAHRFQSDGKTGFSVEPAERAEAGTDVVLHIAPEHRRFLEHPTLRALVERYSDPLAHPIELAVVEHGKAPAFEQVNRGSALWRRAPSDVTPSEYDELYRHLTHDLEPPLGHRHFRVEGTQEFSGILYLPKEPPLDLHLGTMEYGLRLYVKRVLVMERAEELLPRWLRFVHGVLDSEDLPLNVSRELLQDGRVVRTMRKQVVKQSLDMLDELAKTERYDTFFAAYGSVLKEGALAEPDVKDRVASLLRFRSTNGAGLTSLAAYRERAAARAGTQSAIYYLPAPDLGRALASPHLEGYRARGIEVLLATDPIDAFVFDALAAGDDAHFVSVLDGDEALAPSGAATEAAQPTARESNDRPETDGMVASLLRRARQVLEDRVTEVKRSTRLVDSPACLVTAKDALPPHLERALRMRDTTRQPSKRILELNPGHPLVLALARSHAANETSPDVARALELMYDAALLSEGSPIEDGAHAAARIHALLDRALSVSP